MIKKLEVGYCISCGKFVRELKEKGEIGMCKACQEQFKRFLFVSKMLKELDMLTLPFWARMEEETERKIKEWKERRKKNE